MRVRPNHSNPPPYASAPCLSSLFNSSPTTDFRAKGSFWGSQNLGCAPSWRHKLAVVVTQWPNSGLKRSSYTFSKSCKGAGKTGLIIATLPNISGVIVMLSFVNPSQPIMLMPFWDTWNWVVIFSTEILSCDNCQLKYYCYCKYQ